jgi:hypothetical protein
MSDRAIVRVERPNGDDESHAHDWEPVRIEVGGYEQPATEPIDRALYRCRTCDAVGYPLPDDE